MVPIVRCDITDLPVTDCAHCCGLPDPADGERGPWITANYHGTCSNCATSLDPGDQIRADGDGGWLGECCGED